MTIPPTPRSSSRITPMRQLNAEVLIDALCWIGGDGESYSSPIPEPYTFIPKDQRTIALADGSITSSFLTTFGRPSRDTGLESERNNQPTDTQRLYMLNSSDVQRRIERSPRLQAGAQSGLERPSDGNPQDLPDHTLALSNDRPNQQSPSNTSRRRGFCRGRPPAIWRGRSINSKEFLCRH